MKTVMTLLAVAALVLSGCVTVPRCAPMTTAEVIALAEAGMSDADLIARIDRSRTIFQLSVADVLQLRTHGVSDVVIDHMLATYPRWVEREYRSYYYCGPPLVVPPPGWWGPPHPHWAGPPPWW